MTEAWVAWIFIVIFLIICLAIIIWASIDSPKHSIIIPRGPLAGTEIPVIVAE